MQASINSTKKGTDEKTEKQYSEFTEIKIILKQIMVQNNNSSPDKVYPTKAHDTDTELSDNKKDPPLEGGNYMKVCGVWTIKHDISPPKYSELLMKKN